METRKVSISARIWSRRFGRSLPATNLSFWKTSVLGWEETATSWDGVLGRHRVGKLNSKDLLLLSKYAKRNLCITSTMLRFANKYKTNNGLPAPSLCWTLLFQSLLMTMGSCRTKKVIYNWCWTNSQMLPRCILGLIISLCRTEVLYYLC